MKKGIITFMVVALYSFPLLAATATGRIEATVFDPNNMPIKEAIKFCYEHDYLKKCAVIIEEWEKTVKAVNE